MLRDAIRIGERSAKNRLAMPPMATAKSTESGIVTDALIDYYRERTAGGSIGLVITEHSFITQAGKASPGQMSMASDDVIGPLKRLTDAIHAGGALAIAQLNHAGSAAVSSVTGLQNVGPSAVMNPGLKPGLQGELPRALERSELPGIVRLFTDAASRARAAGYDGVEIHCAHGYLLNQFYSPLTNMRDDPYGPQNIENRIRLAAETVAAVRDLADEEDDGFIVAVRLGGADYMEGGSTIDDAANAAAILEDSGADLIDLSGGMCRFIRTDVTGPGYFSDMSLAVRKRVGVPVILTGGILEPEDAERLLSEGAADIIGVGRPVLADAGYADRFMT